MLSSRVLLGGKRIYFLGARISIDLHFIVFMLLCAKLNIYKEKGEQGLKQLRWFPNKLDSSAQNQGLFLSTQYVARFLPWSYHFWTLWVGSSSTASSILNKRTRMLIRKWNLNSKFHGLFLLTKRVQSPYTTQFILSTFSLLRCLQFHDCCKENKCKEIYHYNFSPDWSAPMK